MAMEWRNKWRRKNELQGKYFPGMKVLVFDTETTGLGKSSKVIQFSAVLCRVCDDLSLEVMYRMNMYINPGEKIPEKITEITGITNETLAGQPDEMHSAQIIMQMFHEADICAGYNIGFDIDQIQRLAERTGSWYQYRQTIDVCEMARDFVPKEKDGHSLSVVIGKVFPEREFAFHNSMEDVDATMALLEHFAKAYAALLPETGKRPVHLEKASLFINPRQKSMQRIRLQLSVGNEGDIFYNIPGHFWSCQSTSAAKKLFASIDMCDLEEQVYRKYVYRFKYSGIDEMARSWIKFRNDALKEKKQS